MSLLVKSTKLCASLVNEFLDRNGPYMAAAVSFYSLFSLFPLMLAIISVFGFLLGSPDFKSRLIEGVPEFLPVETDLVSSVLENVASGRELGSVLAALALFAASTAVFSAIRKSINNIWGIRQTRPFIQERLMDVTLMLGAALLILTSVFTTTFLNFFNEIMLVLLPEGAQFDDRLWSRFAFMVPPVTTYFTFFIVYMWLPNTRLSVRDVWFPALLAAIAFEIAKAVFVYYVSTFSRYSDVYGAMSAVIALMAWIYVSTIILLAGALITSRYAVYLSHRDQRKRVEFLSSSLERARRRPAFAAVPGGPDSAA